MKRKIIFSFVGLLSLSGFVLLFGGRTVSFDTGLPGSFSQAVESVLEKGSEPEVKKVEHLDTPEALRALYMTSWVAGTPSLREGLLSLVIESDLNGIVIDIKDDTGRITFDIKDEALVATGAEEIRIPDLKGLIEELHEDDVYVIARMAVFQDPYFTAYRPDLSVKFASNGALWKDRKGQSWVDPGAREFWKYVAILAREAYAIGFDEINFDYIRFPSDGVVSDIFYPVSGELLASDPYDGKAKVIESFFSYLDSELRSEGIVISADIFGITTTDEHDNNIGQVFERALPYFDAVSPMIYPSHYPTGWNGYSNPAAFPGEIIDLAMSSAVGRISTLLSATTTPESTKEKVDKEQLRPWLQDFDLGATYTPAMVQAQIDALSALGIDSWILWDAGNHYSGYRGI